MNDFHMYLLNSAICLSVLYLLFRALLRKEASFKLNRIILLSIVLCSLVIPKLIMPQILQQTIQQPIEFQLPVFKAEATNLQKIPDIDKTALPEKVGQSHFPFQKLLVYSYVTGLLITFLILIYGLISIFNLYRKAKVIRMGGCRLLIVEKEIAAFSFGNLVFISQRDYEDHQRVILAHEKEHIRLGHFYDLLFLEVIKIILWFNPFIYWLIRDMKDIHEFQADDHTLTKGIDATQYQLLIIQKCVGHQKFALVNSFNHCQTKNRIVMMNKQKTGKAWRWKVATFLPVLVLLLLTFCKTGENMSSANKSISLVGTWKLVSYKYGPAEKYTSPDFVAIELITPTHFTWVHYGTNDNKVYDSAGGTYTFDGVNFTPNVEFGAKGMVPWFGKSQYKIIIKGDQYFLSGFLSNQLKIEEVWKKL